MAEGWTAREIVHVVVKSRGGGVESVSQDEGSAKFDESKLRKLRPVFKVWVCVCCCDMRERSCVKFCDTCLREAV